MDPQCYILVGCPGAGKTTWLSNNWTADIASSDYYIDMLASSAKKTYSDVFKEAYPRAEQMFLEDITYAALHNRDIAIDRTNMTLKGRARIMSMLPKHEFTAVVFPRPQNLAERLSSRPGKVITMTMVNRMPFQMPSLDEGFKEIIRL